MRLNLKSSLRNFFRTVNNFFAARPRYIGVFGRALMATILGLFLSTFLIQPLSMTTSALFSSPEKRDFQLPDLYAQIADNRPVRKYEDRIVILNIGRNNRQEIAEALSILSLCGPKAVGIDVNFAQPSEDDSQLIDALYSLPNPVLPLGVSPSKTNGVFSIEEKPFFYGEDGGLNYGIVNLPAGAKGTIREFAVEFPTEQGNIPSFVTALAQFEDPNAIDDIKSMGKETVVTSYHSREYNIINLEDIEQHAEEFADKIVLVGALEDAADMHATPVQSHVAGVMLHAAALSTLLDGIHIERLPKYYDYFLAISLCLGIMLIVFGMKSSFKGLLLRCIQAALVVLAVRVGYGLFVDHDIIFDISFTVTIIAFGLFGVDIWNSIEAVWKFFSKKLLNQN